MDSLKNNHIPGASENMQQEMKDDAENAQWDSYFQNKFQLTRCFSFEI